MFKIKIPLAKLMALCIVCETNDIKILTTYVTEEGLFSEPSATCFLSCRGSEISQEQKENVVNNNYGKNIIHFEKL